MFAKNCAKALLFIQLILPSFSHEELPAQKAFDQIERPFNAALTILYSASGGADEVYQTGSSTPETLFYMSRIVTSSLVQSEFIRTARVRNPEKEISLNTCFPSFWQQLKIKIQAFFLNPTPDWFMDLLAKNELSDAWKQEYLCCTLLNSVVHDRGQTTGGPYWIYKDYIEKKAHKLSSKQKPIKFDSAVVAAEILTLQTAFIKSVEETIGESVIFWPKNLSTYESYGSYYEKRSVQFPVEALAGFPDENRGLILGFFRDDSVKYVIDTLNQAVRFDDSFFEIFIHRTSGFIGSILERLYFDRSLAAVEAEINRMQQFICLMIKPEKFKKMVEDAKLNESECTEIAYIARNYLILEVGYPLVTGESVPLQINYRSYDRTTSEKDHSRGY